MFECKILGFNNATEFFKTTADFVLWLDLSIELTFMKHPHTAPGCHKMVQYVMCDVFSKTLTFGSCSVSSLSGMMNFWIFTL